MTEDQVLSVSNTGPSSQSPKNDESLGTLDGQADPYEAKKSGIITVASSVNVSETVMPLVNDNLMNRTASSTMKGHVFQNRNVPHIPRSIADVSLSVASLINRKSASVSCSAQRDSIVSAVPSSTSVDTQRLVNFSPSHHESEQMLELNRATLSVVTTVNSVVEAWPNAESTSTPTKTIIDPSAATSNATTTKSVLKNPAKLSLTSQTDVQSFKRMSQVSSNHVANTGVSPAKSPFLSPTSSLHTTNSSHAIPLKLYRLNHATSTSLTPIKQMVNKPQGNSTSLHSTPPKSAVVTSKKSLIGVPGNLSLTTFSKSSNVLKPPDDFSTPMHLPQATPLKLSAPSPSGSSFVRLVSPCNATPVKSPVSSLHGASQNSNATPTKPFRPSLATSTHSTPGNPTVSSLHASPTSFHSNPSKSTVITPERPSIAVEDNSSLSILPKTCMPSQSNEAASTSFVTTSLQPFQLNVVQPTRQQNNGVVSNNLATTSLPNDNSVPSTSSQSVLFHSSTNIESLIRYFQQPSVPVSTMLTTGTMSQQPMSSAFDRSKDPLTTIFRAHMVVPPAISSTAEKKLTPAPVTYLSMMSNRANEDEPMEIDVETVDSKPVASSSSVFQNSVVLTTKEFVKTITATIVDDELQSTTFNVNNDPLSPVSALTVVTSSNKVALPTVSGITSSQSSEVNNPALDKLHIASPATSKFQHSKSAFSGEQFSNAHIAQPNSSKSPKPQNHQASKSTYAVSKPSTLNLESPTTSQTSKPQSSKGTYSPNQLRNVQLQSGSSNSPKSQLSSSAYKQQLILNAAFSNCSNSPKPTSSKVAYSHNVHDNYVEQLGSSKSPKPQTSASAYGTHKHRSGNNDIPCSFKPLKPSFLLHASSKSPNSDFDIKPKKTKKERLWGDDALFKCPNTDAYLDSYQDLSRSVKESVEEFIFENHSLMVFRSSLDFMTYTQSHTERRGVIKMQNKRLAEIESARQQSMRKDKAKVRNDALKERVRERERMMREQRKIERAHRRAYRQEHNNGKSMTRQERAQYRLERERRIQERNIRRANQVERRNECFQFQKERGKVSSNDSILIPSSSVATTQDPFNCTATSSTSLQSPLTSKSSTGAFNSGPHISGMNDQTIGMETLASFAATVQGQKRPAELQSPAMTNSVMFSPPAKAARVEVQNVFNHPIQNSNGVLKAPPKLASDRLETTNDLPQPARSLPHPEASFAAAHPPRIFNNDLMAQHAQYVAKFMQMPAEPLQQMFGNQPEVAAAFAPAIAIADRVMKQPNSSSNNIYTDLMTSMARTSASERAGFQKPPPPSSAASASQPAMLPKRTVADSSANSLQPVSASSFSETSDASAHKSPVFAATAKTIALDPSNKNLLLIYRGIQFPLDAALGSQLAYAAFLAPEVLSRFNATDLPLRSAGKHHFIAKQIFEKPYDYNDTCESVDCEVVALTKIINLGPTDNRTPMQSVASTMPLPVPSAQSARPNVSAGITNITTPRSQAAPAPTAATPTGPSVSLALNANVATAQPGPSSIPQMSVVRPTCPLPPKPSLPPPVLPQTATPQEQQLMAQLRALLYLPNRQQQHMVLNQQNEHLRMMAQVNSALGLAGRSMPPARGAPTATDMMLFNEAQRTFNKDFATTVANRNSPQSQLQQQPQRVTTSSNSVVPAPSTALPNADLQNQQFLMSFLSNAGVPNANMMMFGGAPINNPQDPLITAMAQLHQQSMLHQFEIQRQQVLMQQQERIQEEFELQERQRQERVQEQQRAELARKQEQDIQRQQQANLRADLQRQQEELQRQQQAAQQSQQHRPLLPPTATPRFGAPQLPMFPGMASPYFRPPAPNMNSQQQQMASFLASFESEMQRTALAHQQRALSGLPTTSQPQTTTAQQQVDLLQHLMNSELHREAMDAARLFGMQGIGGPRPNIPVPTLNQNNLFNRAPFGISGLGLPPNVPQNPFGKPPTFPTNNPNGNNRE